MLEVFNVLNHDHPWSEEYRFKFMSEYYALAANITVPILKELAQSDLRQSISVVVSPRMTIERGDFFLPSLGYWEAGAADETIPVPVFTIAAAGKLKLGEVTKEACGELIHKVAQDVINQETEAVNKLKDAVDSDDVIMYISKTFECHADSTLIKTMHIGVFGWEKIGLVVRGK